MARRDVVGRGKLAPDATTNLALWLDRYAWELTQQAIGQHQQLTLESVRAPEGYVRAFARRKGALRRAEGSFAGGTTRLFDLEILGRAVVGIGAASVREANLSLLRPWGVPYIPGSALKGIASQLAHEAGGEWKRPAKSGGVAGSLQQAIFGDVERGGSIVFHDAWWVPTGDRVPVSSDTMTVHHVDYYTGKGSAPPADWDEPNPVSFLAMHGTYLAALTGPVKALDAVEALLTEALETRGVGAKRAAGYGRARLSRHVSPLFKSIHGFAIRRVEAGEVAQVAEQFLRLARQCETGEDREAARTVGQKLRDANLAVWNRWGGDASRTAEERDWFGLTEASAAPIAPAPADLAQPWHQARAWIEERGKNRFVRVAVGGFELEQPLGGVRLVEPELEAELVAAAKLPLKDRPSVETQLDRDAPAKKAKPRALRRPA